MVEMSKKWVKMGETGCKTGIRRPIWGGGLILASLGMNRLTDQAY